MTTLEAISRFRADAALARERFHAGDLVDMSAMWFGQLCEVVLLLSEPEGTEPVEVVVWSEEEPGAPFEPFEYIAPIDFLGRYGRLLWRAP